MLRLRKGAIVQQSHARRVFKGFGVAHRPTKNRIRCHHFIRFTDGLAIRECREE